MKVPPELDAGIVVADALWLLVTALLVALSLSTGEPLFRFATATEGSFGALWRAVSVGLVVITTIWLVNVTVTDNRSGS